MPNLFQENVRLCTILNLFKKKTIVCLPSLRACSWDENETRVNVSRRHICGKHTRRKEGIHDAVRIYTPTILPHRLVS